VSNTLPVYIASDLHLGAPDYATSLEREKKFIRWLDSIRGRASELIILGDLFDFWFEYKTAVPRGYVRLLGRLAEMRDEGLPITLFVGNHDLWLRDYFPSELGIAVQHKPQTREFFGKKYYLAHGDGLGPGDHEYKFWRKVFTNAFFNWCFRVSHPDIGLGLGNYFSRRSAKKSRLHDDIDYGQKERLYQFVQDYLRRDASYDYFVFGHRHHAKVVQVSIQTQLIFLGEWFQKCSYLEITAEGGPVLHSFKA
jgi:UDP-2,3-diacylglucosamine hydrolase